MSPYCPCPGTIFGGALGAAGGAGGSGEIVESTWPVIGAIEDPSNTVPITIRINGQVLEKLNVSV